MNFLGLTKTEMAAKTAPQNLAIKLGGGHNSVPGEPGGHSLPLRRVGGRRGLPYAV